MFCGKRKLWVVTALLILSVIFAANTAYASGGGKKVSYAAPVITHTVSNGKSITVNWKAVSGASKYRIFYKKGGV